MPIIGSYRDLDVWAVSMDMVDEVLRRVKAMPRDEFDLKRQIKNAALLRREDGAEIVAMLNRVRPMLGRLYDSLER